MPRCTVLCTHRATTFTIEANDAQGRRTTGGDAFIVIVRGRGAVIRSKVVSMKDGTYEASYRPEVSGRYRITVLLAGEPLPGCPYTAVVSTPSPSPACCVLYGAALTLATARKEEHFELQFRDAQGKLAHAEEVDVYVTPWHAPLEPQASTSCSTPSEDPTHQQSNHGRPRRTMSAPRSGTANTPDTSAPSHAPPSEAMAGPSTFATPPQQPVQSLLGECIVTSRRPLVVREAAALTSSKCGQVSHGQEVTMLEVTTMTDEDGDQIVRARVALPPTDKLQQSAATAAATTAADAVASAVEWGRMWQKAFPYRPEWINELTSGRPVVQQGATAAAAGTAGTTGTASSNPRMGARHRQKPTTPRSTPRSARGASSRRAAVQSEIFGGSVRRSRAVAAGGNSRSAENPFATSKAAAATDKSRRRRPLPACVDSAHPGSPSLVLAAALQPIRTPGGTPRENDHSAPGAGSTEDATESIAPPSNSGDGGDDYPSMKQQLTDSLGRLDRWSLRRHLQSDGRKRMIDVFRGLDGSSDGHLTQKEFTKGVRALGFVDATDAEVRETWAAFDVNSDGRILYDEFDRKMRERPPAEPLQGACCADGGSTTVPQSHDSGDTHGTASQSACCSHGCDGQPTVDVPAVPDHPPNGAGDIMAAKGTSHQRTESVVDEMQGGGTAGHAPSDHQPMSLDASPTATHHEVASRPLLRAMADAMRDGHQSGASSHSATPDQHEIGWITVLKAGKGLVSRKSQLLASDRQKHLQQWTRRLAADQTLAAISAEFPSMTPAKKEALIKQFNARVESAGNKIGRSGRKGHDFDSLRLASRHGQSVFLQELSSDPHGIGFAFGGVDPGKLHSHGQAVETHKVRALASL